MSQFMPEKRSAPLGKPPEEKRASDRYLSCPYCQYFTKYQGALDRHVNRFHEEAIARKGVRSQREGGVYNMQGLIELFQCPKCDMKGCLNQRALDAHMRISHNVEGG